MSATMSTISSEQFGELCDAVWRDRVSILRGQGSLSGEATLVRAVFWRLCKAGIRTKGCADSDGSQIPLVAYQTVVGRMLKLSGRPAFDSAIIMTDLVTRYQNENGQPPAENALPSP